MTLKDLTKEQRLLFAELTHEYEVYIREHGRTGHGWILEKCKDAAFTNELKHELVNIDLSIDDESVDQFLDFGDYRVIEPVGDGSQGVVYRGVHKQSLQTVAIKEHFRTLRIQTLKDDVQFEANVLRQLDHGNIVKFIDAGFEGEKWYTVTEWINGVSLDVAMKSASIPVRVALSIAVQLIDAIEYAAENGVTHCDIKPSNIMVLDSDSQIASIKVLDWGVAHKQGDKNRTAWKGTPGYTAPDPTPDIRSDLYAVGNVLKSMLVSHFGSVFQIPSSLLGVVKRAIRTAPEHRFQTANEMRKALARAQKRTPERATRFDVIRNRVKSVSKKQLCSIVIPYLAAGAMAAMLLVKSISPWLPTSASKANPERPAFSWADCFDGNGNANLYLETIPSNAISVTATPLSSLGEPNPAVSYDLGDSPNRRSLYTGFYLISVEWPDGKTMEAIRFVPDGRISGHIHPSAPGGLTKKGERICLAPVKYVEPDIGSVVLIEGVEFDEKTTKSTTPTYWRKIAYSLEASGKRLPFKSELKLLGATVPNELTQTIHHIGNRGQAWLSLNNNGKEPCVVLDHASTFLYRGVVCARRTER